MQTITNQTINTTYSVASANTSVWTKFMKYCKGQESNRLMWVGIVLATHGCILTPVTVMITFFAGQSFVLFMTGMIAMAIALVTNLAAMPTRITIPAFVLSIVIDFFVIISSILLFA